MFVKFILVNGNYIQVPNKAPFLVGAKAKADAEAGAGAGAI